MNRLLPQSASGVLFSPKAGSNAKPDVRRPRNATRSLYFNPNSHQQSTAQNGFNFLPAELPDKYSIFSGFEETLIARSRTQLPLADDPAVPPTFLSEDPITLCLPILSVSIDVSIDRTISLTELTQTFHNPAEYEISEARHTFPLYHGAVVTSFQCMIGQSRRLHGVVKATSQARNEFIESKRKKKVAALLEEHTPEIFETSLGSIPAKTTITVTLTYVHELKAVMSKKEKSEGLALIIPASVAPRYAAAATPGPLPKVLGDKLGIQIRVLDNGDINPVTSCVESNHPTATYEGLQPSSSAPIMNIAELHSRNAAISDAQKSEHIWKYTSKSQPTLKSDFIFVIQMSEQTRLQSCAVITPPNDKGHAALMVSLRPNDLFGSAVRPEMFKGEVLFVIDRSGSMDWTEEDIKIPKIETARDAISLVLHGLPFTCKFNIISFGSEVRGMWNRSRGANQPENLSFASKYLTTIKADMIGTEILLALKGAVSNREPSCSSTQVILITDGEIVDESHTAILQYVWETRKKLGEHIRFFTLGIGEGVSHSVLESIAELGGGYCDVIDITKKPGWEDRLNRMARSAMEPNEWMCDIAFGPGYERRSLADYAFGVDDKPEAGLTVYAQGPHLIPPLDPFRYKSVFFLLDLKNTELPKTITIKTTADVAKKNAYIMDVVPSQLREKNTIHPLAVKAILRSLEDEVKGAGTNEEQARNNAELLGTTYAVSSKWTSFVALADDNVEHGCQIDAYKSLLRETSVSDLWLFEDEELLETEIKTTPHITEAYFPRTEELMAENVMAENVMTKEVMAEEVWTEEVMAEEVMTKKVMAEEVMTEEVGCGSESYLEDIDPEESERLKTTASKKGKGLATTDTPISKEQIFNTPQEMEECLNDHVEKANLDIFFPKESSYVSQLAENAIKIKSTKKSLFNPNAESTDSDDGNDRTADRFLHRSLMVKQSNVIRTALRRFKLRLTLKGAVNDNASFSLSSEDTDDDENESSQSLSSNRDQNSTHFVRRALKRVKQRVFRGIGVKNNESPESSSENTDDDYNSSNSFMTTNAENDVLFHIPSHDGPLTWHDAAGCEKGGLFILPSKLQNRLGQHFCNMTVKRLQETLGRIPGMPQATKEDTSALVDTLMMIQYFKTHLSVQENYWCLLVEKARCALLPALGYTEDQEEALEPLYEMLLSAILHVHFPESMKHASVHQEHQEYQEETDTSPNVSGIVRCLVCNGPIEANYGSQLAANEGFMCLADDCCDTDPQFRKRYANWAQFWEHQVKSGHLICPETEDMDV